MVPLFILCTYKPKARNPRNVNIAELFTVPPDSEHDYFHSGVESSGTQHRLLRSAFLLVDRVFRMTDFLIPRAMRAAATKRAENWFLERLNGSADLGPRQFERFRHLGKTVRFDYAREYLHCLQAVHLSALSLMRAIRVLIRKSRTLR